MGLQCPIKAVANNQSINQCDGEVHDTLGFVPWGGGHEAHGTLGFLPWGGGHEACSTL